MSVALLLEGGKYYRKCTLFLKRVLETFQRCLSLIGCHKKMTPTSIYKEKLTYQLLVEKIGIHLTDTPVVSILLFPRAVITQFIN